MAYRTTSWKNTDIGKIPSDWELKKLSDIFTLSVGGDVDKNAFSSNKDSKHPYPIYANALVDFGIYGYSSSYRIESEAITITGRGDVGHVFYRTGKFTPIVRLLVGIAKKSYDTKFLSYAVQKINFYVESTGVPQLTVPHVGMYVLSYPKKLIEQQKIAEVLTDIDDLIVELERVRDKKIAIKTGVMQELLSGKRRLPGFNKPWKKDCLSNLCDIETGKKDVNEGNSSGQYPFFTCAKTHTFADTFSYEKEAILIAGNGDVGNCQYYNGKFEAYQRTYILSNFRTNVRLLFQILNTRMSGYAESQKQQGAMPYIKLGVLTDFIVYMPEDLEEQKAITDILADMDDEISAINDKINKYKQIKSGVAGELLSGRIRLVKPQE